MNATEKVARALFNESWPNSKIDGYETYVGSAFAAIQAYQDHLKEQGLTIVPIEPTPEMDKVGEDYVWGHEINADSVYKVMLAAYRGEDHDS